MTAGAALVVGCAVAALCPGSPADAGRRLRHLRRPGAAGRSGPTPAAERAAGVRPLRRFSGRGEAAGAEHVVGLLAAFAAELRSGAAPAVAVERCAHDVIDPELSAALEPAVEMLRLGADGPSALRLAAGTRWPELAWLAAGWELADAHGVPLAPAATRIAKAARDQLRHSAQIRAELAGPRASARLLALLPLVGLALGVALGADPVHVLVATPVGAACLLAAGALEYAGVRWTAALVRRAEATG